MTTPIHRYDTVFTDIDLNSTGTTTVADPSNDARVPSVHLTNGGGTAEVRLEVTDGTDTAVLTDPGAGANIDYQTDIMLDENESVQIVVEVAEGTAQTNTAAVGVAEH